MRPVRRAVGVQPGVHEARLCSQLMEVLRSTTICRISMSMGVGSSVQKAVVSQSSHWR
jgi:hypothetical protein